MDGTSRIDELEQKFIENPRRYFAPLANEYRKAGNPHQAIAICRAHLGQLPGHMSGQIVYGQALFEGGEFEQARTVFENALAMDRENLVALRHLGDLALREGETAAARQWYEKLLEFDPQDAAVIALAKEIDSGTVRQPAASETETPEQPAEAPVAEAQEPAPAPASFHSQEEDNLMAEELGYPVPPPQAFVTETMAELYLAQGFRDRAISVYKQLVELRPDDERMKTRLAELESPDAPVVDRREQEPSVEAPETTPDSDRAPSIETPTPPETEPPSEDSGLSDGFVNDSPPSERTVDGPDSVEAPTRDEPRAEPEGIAASPIEFVAAPLDVAAQLTVRDFFASLGRRKPSSRSNGTNGAGEDTRAAAALAGAFGGTGQASSSGTPTPSEASPAPGKESEEDVARFRAWLDGLTGQ
jgi:tetratricopeptide (TPR) repeat protein